MIYSILPVEGSLLKLIKSMHLSVGSLFTLAVNVHNRTSVIGDFTYREQFV